MIQMVKMLNQIQLSNCSQMAGKSVSIVKLFSSGGFSSLLYFDGFSLSHSREEIRLSYSSTYFITFLLLLFFFFFGLFCKQLSRLNC